MAVELTNLVDEIGQAGRRLDHMQACEASAGNISVAVADHLDMSLFPDHEDYELPADVPQLAGWTVIVTGSGTRLRDVLDRPQACLAAVVIGADGHSSTLYSSPRRTFARPTSEFNTHLGVHADHLKRHSAAGLHAVVHAQPPYLVMLSHIPSMIDSAVFSKAIMRWEPETVLQLPNGIGIVPFTPPGSDDMRTGTLEQLRTHQIAVWLKHGVIACSDQGPASAVDKIEYAETGAMYEWRNRSAGSPGSGLSDDEVRQVARDWNVKTDLY